MAERIIHSGKFINYNNEEVTVTFYSNDLTGPSSQNDLTFSGENPVVINYNGDTGDIYAPVKTSSCDVNIVSPHILDDLYTGKKNDIKLRVEKGTTVSRRVLTFSDNGSVVTGTVSTDTQEGYEIYTRNQFFTDINGDFRFTGRVVPSGGGTAETVFLKYDTTNNKWIRNNDWNLEFGDQYFYVGSYSYRVTYDGIRHYVQEWTGSAWGQTYNYNVVRGGTTSDCDIDAKNIVYFKDGGVELLYALYRYTWNRSQHAWVQQTYYTDSTGRGTYSSAYGFRHHRVRNSSGTIVDALVVSGYTTSGGTTQNYMNLTK